MTNTNAPRLKKICLEEHFAPAGFMTSDPTEFAAKLGLEPETAKSILNGLDLSEKLREMNASGVDVCVVSLQAPGIEGISDPHEAAAKARMVNDYLAKQCATSNGRLEGFASVPLQDPVRAVEELEYCVNALGFRAVMVNGYSTSPDGSPIYLDDRRFDALWTRCEELGTPVYLHPRVSVKGVLEGIYAGHPEMHGANFGFAVETSAHAMRLIWSGLFDRHPRATVILGHLGEGLPFLSWRLEHTHNDNPLGTRTKKTVQAYLSENFFFTTSGFFSDHALQCTLATVGADRVLGSVDSPYEKMAEYSAWIERTPVSESDRRKIAHENAAKLFGLKV